MPRGGKSAWAGAVGLLGTVVAVLVVAALLTRHEHGPPARLPATIVPAAGNDVVFLEPDQGFGPVRDLVRGARSSVEMTMYELVDADVEQALADAAARGVRVRVLLDGRLERHNNTPAYDFLRAHGVSVAWSSSRFPATHQKSFVVDGSLAVVLTANLASRYYPNTRDFGVVTRDVADVAAIRRVFEADFAGRGVRPGAGDDLLWSPGAEQAVVGLLDAARVSVAVESEELSDTPVVDALVRAARRGVRVSLVMTYQQRYAANLKRLVAAGVRVGYYQGELPLYIHAKALAVDAGAPGARALVSSQNLGPVSLRADRELGIVLTDPRQVLQVATVVERDLAGARAYG